MVGYPRRILITGAAGGIGQAVAAQLSSEGDRLVCVDRRGGTGILEADLSTRTGNERAVEAALEQLDGLDAVIACAGLQHVEPIDRFDEDAWDELLAVILTSPFLLARHAWSALAASGRGRIIVLGSAHGIVASPFKAAYVAAKHGVVGLVKALALEGAERGIAAVTISPGYVRTDLVERQLDAQAASHGVPRERALHDIVLAQHAVKRLIEPDEVALAVSFVLGPAGMTLTGTSLTMDMGWTAR
jgi:3-hydroxybutyrate dehydrogenase